MRLWHIHLPTPLPRVRQELILVSQRKSAFQHGWTCGLNIVLVITASQVCSASQSEYLYQRFIVLCHSGNLWWMVVFWKLYMIKEISRDCCHLWKNFFPPFFLIAPVSQFVWVLMFLCSLCLSLPETWIVWVLRIGHWSPCLLRKCSKPSMTSSPISSSLTPSWSTKKGRSSYGHSRIGRIYSNRKWVSLSRRV